MKPNSEPSALSYSWAGLFAVAARDGLDADTLHHQLYQQWEIYSDYESRIAAWLLSKHDGPVTDAMADTIMSSIRPTKKLFPKRKWKKAWAHRRIRG